MSLHSLIWDVVERHLRENTTLCGVMTVEEIAVACWLEDPQEFGMRGFQRAHPDLRKVVATLSGSNGMVAKRHLIREKHLSTSRYRLGTKPQDRKPGFRDPQTQANATATSNRNQKQRIEDQALVERLYSTKAARKMKSGSADSLTVVDAMEFFGVRKQSELSKGNPVKELQDHLELILGGGVYQPEQVNFLRNVAGRLADVLKRKSHAAV